MSWVGFPGNWLLETGNWLMFDFLDKLRTKPDSEKKRVALCISGGITAVVAVFWWVSFTASPKGGISVGEALSPMGGLASSFSTAKNMVTDAFDNIATEIDKEIPVATTSDEWADAKTETATGTVMGASVERASTPAPSAASSGVRITPIQNKVRRSSQGGTMITEDQAITTWRQ